MNRKDAQKIAINSAKNIIKKHGEDYILMTDVKSEKTWTAKEWLEAAEKDTCVEGGDNPVDRVLEIVKNFNPSKFVNNKGIKNKFKR